MFDTLVEIAIRIPVRSTFTYRVPPGMVELLEPGKRVNVPFNNREEEGIITRIHNELPDYEMLEILEVRDPEPVLTEFQLELGQWMSEYYFAGLGECYFKMFPGARRFPKPKNKLAPTDTPVPSHDLNEEQRVIVDSISQEVQAGRAREDALPGVHLVHGVTGSGKTEVYIHLILESLKEGRGALLLVPEISLTVQLIGRLKEVFGERLALLHSALKKSERFASYLALKRGEKNIAVGTRSAVFAPLANPGIIIMDEEHDGSYKEHSAPRYHARQVAFQRARKEGSVLVLGSATPAVESCYQSRRGEGPFFYHRLNYRATGAKMPHVEPIKIENPDVPITGQLVNEIDRNLKAGHQSLLLLNRRGYHPYMYCQTCEESLVCLNCSVTLNLHRNGKLVCHYCSHSEPDRGKCNRCGSPTKRLGSGTQKLEEYLFNLFPKIRLERLDTDTAGKKNTVQDCINRLLDGEIDVLMGTQMIAKGLDAPNVTLVGVLQADAGLHMPDFRAAERTFSLLTQVAGRAGRGEHPGRVFFEVMNPQNSVIQYAREQDYEGFYGEEIKLRQDALYPPFCRLVRLLFRGENETKASGAADRMTDLLLKSIPAEAQEQVQILGPAPAPLLKLHNQYRYHIIIKTNRPTMIRRILEEQAVEVRRITGADTHLEIDFDPVDLL